MVVIVSRRQTLCRYRPITRGQLSGRASVHRRRRVHWARPVSLSGYWTSDSFGVVARWPLLYPVAPDLRSLPLLPVPAFGPGVSLALSVRLLRCMLHVHDRSGKDWGVVGAIDVPHSDNMPVYFVPCSGANVKPNARPSKIATQLLRTRACFKSCCTIHQPITAPQTHRLNDTNRPSRVLS